MSGAQGRLGNVDSQAAACAGHEPNLLLGHLRCTPCCCSVRRVTVFGVARPREAAGKCARESLSWGSLTGPLGTLAALLQWGMTSSEPRPRDAVRAEIREFLSTRRA